MTPTRTIYKFDVIEIIDISIKTKILIPLENKGKYFYDPEYAMNVFIPSTENTLSIKVNN